MLFRSVPLVTGKEHVKSGELHGLGLTAKRRAPDLDVAPIAEQGLPDFDTGGWQALFVAAGTPMEIVRRIREEAIKVFEEPAIKARTDGFGLIPVFSTPEEFARFYREDVEGFKRIVRDAKIPLQE